MKFLWVFTRQELLPNPAKVQARYFPNKQPDLKFSLGQGHDQRQFNATGGVSNGKGENYGGKFLRLLYPQLVKYLSRSTASNTQMLIFL